MNPDPIHSFYTIDGTRNFHCPDEAPFFYPRSEVTAIDDRRYHLQGFCEDKTWDAHGVNYNVYRWKWDRPFGLVTLSCYCRITVVFDIELNEFEYTIHPPTFHITHSEVVPDLLPAGSFRSVHHFYQTPETTPPPALRPTLKGKALQRKLRERKFRLALKKNYLTAQILGRRPVASDWF